MNVDERIEAIVSKINHPILKEASHYALFSGGKRLRPKMTLSIAGDLGLDVACAIELIHTYTLIHDDLPAMDNDDLRRGKPTLHKAFDEATAILTGDLLLTLAFQVISESELPDSVIVAITRLISRKIGPNGIIEGQLLDLASESIPLTWPEYQHICLRKTADLFDAALLAGALIQNLPESDLSIYSSFGKAFGLLYQIQDDLEDKNSTISIRDLESIRALLTLHATRLLSNLSTHNSFLVTLLDHFDQTASHK
jgi:geranylgeranyl diphosphate synthase type II